MNNRILKRFIKETIKSLLLQEVRGETHTATVEDSNIAPVINKAREFVRKQQIVAGTFPKNLHGIRLALKPITSVDGILDAFGMNIYSETLPLGSLVDRYYDAELEARRVHDRLYEHNDGRLDLDKVEDLMKAIKNFISAVENVKKAREKINIDFFKTKMKNKVISVLDTIRDAKDEKIKILIREQPKYVAAIKNILLNSVTVDYGDIVNTLITKYVDPLLTAFDNQSLNAEAINQFIEEVNKKKKIRLKVKQK